MNGAPDLTKIDFSNPEHQMLCWKHVFDSLAEIRRTQKDQNSVCVQVRRSFALKIRDLELTKAKLMGLLAAAGAVGGLLVKLLT